MEIIKKSSKALNKALLVLKRGGVVVCPTDTIYGFLADASNKKAVEKIYKIKKRPRSKPLPVFVKDLKMAKELAKINEEQEKILKKYWPGRYTFVLNRKIWGVKNPKFYGLDKRTVAIRIPKYKFLNDLLKKINRPLVQTSVNISTKNPLTKINDIIKQFNKLDIIAIDAGNLKRGRLSKVLHLENNKIKVLRK